MPDQHVPQNVDVGRDVTDADTGQPIITREQVQRDRAEWTAQHPPIPGLRWQISYGIDGQVRERRLVVIPGWEDAFAPDVATKPTSAAQHDVRTDPAEANRLGALAYQGWFSALPESVRQAGGAAWDGLPEPFRAPLRHAAILVWQHGENAGFHQALLRTLPAAQLGAAGEMENLADFLAGVLRLNQGDYDMPSALAEIRSRVAQLRQKALDGARRAREQSTDR